MKSVQIPSGLIHRDEYISQVQPFIRKQMIKVFTGQRRVGKSYILFQLIEMITVQDPDAVILYINKEDLAFDEIRTATDLNEFVVSRMVPHRMHYLFIDEIQEIPDFEKALRSLLLKENVDIYCTGSNANLLSGELATLLSGRFIEIRVRSLSFPEFLRFHQLHDTGPALQSYLKYGGLPYLIHLPMKEEVIFEYLKSILSTIVFRDVISRYNIRNTRFLERLVLFLADNTGQQFSARRISEFLKSQQIRIAPGQVQVYADHLAAAFLIHRVERYDLIGKRIFEIGEKYYFENMGIRHAIVGFKPQDLGKILENAVYNHLVFRGWKVMTGTLGAEEIDFICEKEGEKMYVQVALRLEGPRTIDREFGNLLKIRDNYRKIVITMDSFEGNTYQGIEHLNARAFLAS